MDFRIADTFTDSLGRLTSDEQKLVKTTAFDLQLNPINPGMSFHKLDRAKDANFWSVRVGSDIRLIVHKTAGSLLLCCVAGSILDWPQHLMPVHPVGMGDPASRLKDAGHKGFTHFLGAPLAMVTSAVTGWSQRSWRARRDSNPRPLPSEGSTLSS